jgi:hypothetical protein
MYIGVAWWGYCECIGHEHITPQELREFPVVVRPEFRTFLLGVNSPVFGLLGSLCCFLDTFLVLARTKKPRPQVFQVQIRFPPSRLRIDRTIN